MLHLDVLDVLTIILVFSPLMVLNPQHVTHVNSAVEVVATSEDARIKVDNRTIR